jgi:hypothetical protein
MRVPRIARIVSFFDLLRSTKPADPDADALAAAQAQAELALQVEIDDLLWVMKHPQGRRFVWRQLSAAGLYRPSFTGDQATTFFNEGRRALGLQLLASLDAHCPEDYMRMLQEHQ